MMPIFLVYNSCDDLLDVFTTKEKAVRYLQNLEDLGYYNAHKYYIDKMMAK